MGSEPRPVLLFFKDFETDRFLPHDRYVKRVLRTTFERLGRPARMTGFRMWFQLLVLALEKAGHDVVVNDFRLARQNPALPVGLVGYPHLLQQWDLPNPAILGPALLNHPAENIALMDDSRFRYYLVTCDWMDDLFRPVYGDKVRKWHAGIDVDQHPNRPASERNIDLLVYDKIRWNREKLLPLFMGSIERLVAKYGLRCQTVTYGQYRHDHYLEQVSRSRSMLFLCEHETQGMAYQEAMAANVPILAWDNGVWRDPDAARFSDKAIPASSVPYFSEACGRRFADPGDLETHFEGFWRDLDSFYPRGYVSTALSLETSASQYMTLVNSLNSR